MEPASSDYLLPPVTDTKELIEQADAFAIEVLGYKDSNANLIPDYREKWIPNVSDCSTISAELDNILEVMGLMGALNSEQAFGAGQIRDYTVSHAYNYVPGIGFIDITPAFDDDGWHPHIGPPHVTGNKPLFYLAGYPDSREIPDPAYQGPTALPLQEPVLLPIHHPEDDFEIDASSSDESISEEPNPAPPETTTPMPQGPN